ncbi:UPF0462 protein C4orf33 homolog isoform X3 [Argonauta hians]
MLVIFSFTVLLLSCVTSRQIDPAPKKPLLEFKINKKWNGGCVPESETVNVRLEGIGSWLRLEFESPFYDDPKPPNGIYGQPHHELFNYEVVESFFLNDNNQYLEVELGPHGQHLVLMLNGYRNMVTQQLPLQIITEIKNSRWRGVAYIPEDYFPPNITKFNSYAIHGTGENKTYLSLYPTPEGQYPNPDFHRLGYFENIDFSILPPFQKYTEEPSQLWKMFPPNS